MMRVSGIILLTIMFTCIAFTACNTEKHYRTLSIFFDGVPEPRAEIPNRADSVQTDRATGFNESVNFDDSIKPDTASVHPVYRPNQCDRCHDVTHGYRLNQRQPALCYKCHDDFKNQFKKLHGPVAAGFCTACHLPHQSNYRPLLKKSPRENCRYCHQAGDVGKNSAHADNSDIECRECHNPHGGPNKYFLN